MRHRAQHRIAHRVALRIVDLLEAVEIDEQHRQVRATPARERDGVFGRVVVCVLLSRHFHKYKHVYA